jgi:hypothetical protein
MLVGPEVLHHLLRLRNWFTVLSRRRFPSIISYSYDCIPSGTQNMPCIEYIITLYITVFILGVHRGGNVSLGPEQVFTPFFSRSPSPA